ncbi:hypothetical protein B0J13DRAFT_158501 [Dactylonectria estremocensis]|uniref:Zn(2)-C6 fungal-type domain-containing protein n=1 Tax=Dactylonectria estremocensis TaxID=1079267 RepID=A0A9P9DM34_9HYPO|nr:hypothetical protein B0J13DRAFT_158501 [Dactylonectria estremocensis]
MRKGSAAGKTSVRRSCERCRKKKSRCPAEQPICSFCHRLNQTCIYLPRYKSKHGSTRLKPTNAFSAETDSSSVAAGRPSNRRQTASLDGAIGMPSISNVDSLHQDGWQVSAPEPPSELLGHFVDIYRGKIYFQPLPLFNLKSLRDELLSFPNHLRWLFLALALRHSNHPFFAGVESEAVEFYTTHSRNVTMELAIRGVAGAEVLQSLCLLALCEILAGEPARAWMTIGTASRLEALRLSSVHAPSDGHSNADAMSRCHWSIVILEKAFTPSLSSLMPSRHRPDYPQSPSRPAPLESCVVGKSYCPGLSNVHEPDSQDLGINAHTLQFLPIWGDIVSYLQDIRAGNSHSPWMSTSTHSQLAVRGYELECQSSHLHLLRNVSFPDRAPSELTEHREYWTSWLLMEIITHASQCALNNPFIHLVVLRGPTGGHRPRSFLQQTVDQALFNSRWVANLVQMCEDLSFEICDPLIGQAVAATATVPWLFQFARDETVAARAKQNLAKFETLLKHQSKTWPHIAHKLKILQSLQTAVDAKPQDAASEAATIRIQPELLWELLDPSIFAADPNSLLPPSDSPSATIQITTKLVHPVSETQEDQPLVSNGADNFWQVPFEGFQDSFLDEFLSETFLSGTLQPGMFP